MATSQTTDMQVEGEVSVEEAVKEMLAAEEEAGEQDPIEGMGNAQIAEVYYRMNPEDRCLFRQFKRFHKLYYETHGLDAPTHQLAHGIVQQMFPGLPSPDTDIIADMRREILAAERLRELCKQLGLVVPTQLQTYPSPPEAPEYPPPPQPPRFLSRQDKERAAQQQPLVEAEEAEIKPNVKPRRLATLYLGPPRLLRMIGSGMKTISLQEWCQEWTHYKTLKMTTPFRPSLSIMTLMHQVMWMTSLKSPWLLPVVLENRSSKDSCQTSRHSTNEWQLLWTPWPQGLRTCQWNKLKRRQ